MKTNRKFKGQSLLEFALIIPLVMLLTTAFIDLGRAIFYYASVTNVAREGARFEIVDTNYKVGPFIDAVSHINSKAFGMPALDLTPTSCASTYDCTFKNTDIIQVSITRLWDSASETYLKVRVIATYHFKPITPGLLSLIGSGGIPLSAESTMRLAAAARY